MTVVELSPNGNGSGRAAAMRALDAADGNLPVAEIARLAGVKERQARNLKAAWKAENGNRPGSAAPAPRVAQAAKQPATRAPRARQPQSATRRRDPWQVACTAMVLAVGLAVSYSHIVHLALLAGGGWWAWVMPLPLDGMALVSIRHLARERRYPVAWAGVAVGAVGSLTANVLAIDPTLADLRYVRWGFAALPPIAVVLCGHLLDRGGR